MRRSSLALKLPFRIQNFRLDQYLMVRSWWIQKKEIPPEREMMPVGTTFMLYLGEIPAMCLTLFLTNSPVFWVDNLIKNPELAKEDLTEGKRLLLAHLEHFAKVRGAKRLLCLSMKRSTERYYKHLGFQKSAAETLTSFLKEIE